MTIERNLFPVRTLAHSTHSGLERKGARPKISIRISFSLHIAAQSSVTDGATKRFDLRAGSSSGWDEGETNLYPDEFSHNGVAFGHSTHILRSYVASSLPSGDTESRTNLAPQERQRATNNRQGMRRLLNAKRRHGMFVRLSRILLVNHLSSNGHLFVFRTHTHTHHPYPNASARLSIAYLCAKENSPPPIHLTALILCVVVCFFLIGFVPHTLRSKYSLLSKYEVDSKTRRFSTTPVSSCSIKYERGEERHMFLANARPVDDCCLFRNEFGASRDTFVCLTRR